MVLLSAVVSGRGTSGSPVDDCAIVQRPLAFTRPTQSAFNSSRASRAIASGGALGSSFFGAGGRKTKRELKIKFALVPATIPRKAAIA
jgi:hypothetical protein